MDNLIGLIPAAGKGVRLALPYPKELYPIIRNNRYKPVAQFVVENLLAAGVKHIVFVINETKHQLIGYFGSGQRFGCHFSYVVQENKNGDSGESTSPGLAHALNSAYHLTAGKTVLFGMADTIMNPPDLFAQMLAKGQPTDEAIMGLYRVTRPEKFGMVEYNGDELIQQIVDKPLQTDLEYAWGCIIWRPAFTEHLKQQVDEERVSDFALIMNRAIQKGMTFRSLCLDQGSYADLGTYDEIAELERKYRE
jgi:glucose-1-phosphate thymidylyltransferase